jgi:spermidine/putrescine transport system substrate-binding protein
MSNTNDQPKPLTETAFLNEFMRLKRGSVTKRHFLQVTGLGLATAVFARELALGSSANAATVDLGKKMSLATWPNYHDPANFEAFKKKTGVAVAMNVFGSNEEMLAKLQAGGSGWDVFVPTNYTISTYAKLGLIEPLDLSKIPNYDRAQFDKRFIAEGTVDGKTYAIPKNWGTTGFVMDSNKIKKPMSTWKDFWDITMKEASGRVVVMDYQLCAIGNALKYFGYSFNSVDPKELAQAEALLIKSKPHLFAINSDYQPPMRAGDAWLSMCWTGDGTQLNKDLPNMKYVIAKEGGEIWCDFLAIPKESKNKAAAYAFINFLLDPANSAKEVNVHGYPSPDQRVTRLLPKAILENPIVYPAKEFLTPLEFGAAATLTSPLRAEVMARFKSA